MSVINDVLSLSVSLSTTFNRYLDSPLTIFSLVPDNALQNDARSRFTRSEAVRIRYHANVGRLYGHVALFGSLRSGFVAIRRSGSGRRRGWVRLEG